jgi:hypothetical protein
MDADPGQLTDISNKKPEVAEKLKKAAEDWRKTVLSELPKKDDRPFPIGYTEFPITVLPARDGVAHGTIQRSARAPNCSYFTNWTSTEDRITWNVAVATEGTYSVEVLYTCGKDNLGTSVRFQLGDKTLTRKVDISHDPPATGAENDRVPRLGESLVKDFKPFNLGETTLPRGKATLTLTCPEITGNRGIEVRSVILTLKKR